MKSYVYKIIVLNELSGKTIIDSIICIQTIFNNHNSLIALFYLANLFGRIKLGFLKLFIAFFLRSQLKFTLFVIFLRRIRVKISISLVVYRCDLFVSWWVYYIFNYHLFWRLLLNCFINFIRSLGITLTLLMNKIIRNNLLI